MGEWKHTLRTLSLVVGVFACTSACATTSTSQPAATTPTAPVAARSSAVPNLYDAHRLVEQYIDGGGYEADVAKVVADARAFLEERSKAAVKPAIVLDVDETSL